MNLWILSQDEKMLVPIGNKIMIKIDYELRDIIVCALRYALPRHTYAVEEVCSYIKNIEKF